MKYVALIPAYKPSAFLSELLKELQSYGFENVLVDDGSGMEYEHIFFESSRYGEVLYHVQNAGKGAALKTGLAYIATHFPKDAVVVTVDADGQHKPNDALAICKLAETHPRTLVLGSRKLNADVLLRSKMGNTITRFVYRVPTGLKVYDTQTGLRAFRADMIPELLAIPGSRYEYEMNALLQFAEKRIPIVEHEIETVYFTSSANHYRLSSSVD